MSAFMHSWSQISPNRSPLGTMLTLMWCILVPKSHILGSTWAYEWLSCHPLGPSGSQIGANLAQLGRTWSHLGANLNHLGANLDQLGLKIIQVSQPETTLSRLRIPKSIKRTKKAQDANGPIKPMCFVNILRVQGGQNEQFLPQN